MQSTTAPFYIGSKNRLDFPMGRLFAGGTLLVEPQEFKEYRARYSSIYKVVELLQNDRGFGFMLNSILLKAIADDNQYYLFCDDDLLGFSWRDKHPFRMLEMFNRGVQIMEQHGLSQLMISFAGHNWFSKTDLKFKIGAWGCFIAKADDLMAVGGYDVDLPIFNDWDISAKLILAEKKTACWYEPMFNHKMKSRAGGAQKLYEQKGTTEKAIAILKQRYGDKVIKEVQAHGQTEARFNWAKL